MRSMTGRMRCLETVRLLLPALVIGRYGTVGLHAEAKNEKGATQEVESCTTHQYLQSYYNS